MLNPRAEGDARQERFFRRVFECSEDCIKLLLLDGALLEMNEHGQRILEIADIDEFVNTPWADFWKDPAHHQAAESAVASARAGRAASFTGFFPTVGGTPKWWHVIVSPVFDDAGNPECLLSVSRDVTAQFRAEQELRTRYDREHEVLVELQRALLPPELPHIEGLRIDAVYIPATPTLQVGGDWYDAFVLKDGRLVVSVGDVCGHSLQSAIIMGKVRVSVRAFALEQRTPSAILKGANDMLRLHFPDTIATAWVGLTEITRNAQAGEAALRDALLALHDEGAVPSAQALKNRLIASEAQDDVVILTVGF